MPPDALERVPEERKKDLLAAAPSFRPPLLLGTNLMKAYGTAS
jgi:hypothetical protein